MTSTAEDARAAEALRHGWTPRSFATTYASQIGITVAFVVLWAAFIALASGTFLNSRIYVSFAQTTPYFALPALALTMVIVSGDIDLSFPSIYGLSMVGFVAVERTAGNVELAVLTALAVGAVAGLLNGVIVTVIGIPALVVTIGTQFLYRGLTLALVSGRSYALVEARDSAAFRILDGRLLGIPMQFVWLTVVALVIWLLLFRHRLGQNGHVIGDNSAAAQLMGIPIRSTRTMMFVVVGVASALAAVMQSLQVSNFYPGVGAGYLLPALAAVFVGGTSVFGGRGTVWGTFIGAFMIGAIQAAIVAMGVAAFWTEVIYGGIILAAVSTHAILQRRFER
ncbi:MAG TPA: ABC transporter permease [Actinomycetota bacterium]